jgi:ribonucleoside-diphosphate reductase alpha chain
MAVIDRAASLASAVVYYLGQRAKKLGRNAPIRTGNYAYKVGAVKELSARRVSSLEKKLRAEYESLPEPDFNPVSVAVLQDRYLKKTEDGEFLENTKDCLYRVAKTAAMVEAQYGKKDADVIKYFKQFYSVMASCDVMPNSPTLMNAGMALGQLSACFVLPIGDSISNELEGGGIFDSVRETAIVHKSGGGTGFSFGNIRPSDDFVSTTYGRASGVLSFLNVFNSATEEINQGGFRRGANMGVLPVHHPQILQWINAKTDGTSYRNFNLSVGITDEFIDAYKKDKEYNLINPRNKKVVGSLKAKEVFDLIVRNAHQYGEPGIIFIDRMDKHNPTPHIGKLESTNPCGEQPLLPYEACNLGSINIANCVDDKERFNFKKLKGLIKTTVRFLDDIIDASNFPIYHIAEMVGGNRKIGMGIMGFTDALIKMGVPYDSEDAVKWAKKIMKFVEDESHQASQRLGKEKGNFPNFKGSIYDGEVKHMRNATVTTLAPTGSISLIANNVSSGIEPLFRVRSARDITGSDTRLQYFSQGFEYLMRKAGKDPHEFMEQIKENNGSVQGLKGIPKEVQRLCKISGEIEHEWHYRIQEAIQMYTDNAVSKTVNFFADTPVEEVRTLFERAMNSKYLKGLTVYREGSRVDVIGSGKDGKGLEGKIVFHNVEKPELLMEKPVFDGYKVEIGQKEKIHLLVACTFHRHKKTGQIYVVPYEIFQAKRPLGHAESTRFGQSGIDRSRILSGKDPDWAELIEDLKSAREVEWGFGPKKTFGHEHSVGVALEYILRRHGIVGNDKDSGQLVNLISKTDLEPEPVEDVQERREIQKEYFKLRGNFKKEEAEKIDPRAGMDPNKCPTCKKELIHEGGCHGGRCPDGHVDSC